MSWCNKKNMVFIFLFVSTFIVAQENTIKQIELIKDSLEMNNISNYKKQELYDKAIKISLLYNDNPILLDYYFDLTLKSGFNHVQTGDVNDSLINSIELTIDELSLSNSHLKDSLSFKYQVLLSNLHTSKGDLKNAKSILKKLLKSQGIKDEEKSSVLSELSFIFSVENKIDSSVFYIENAIKLDEKTNNRRNLIINIYSKGEIYLYSQNYYKAYESYKKAILNCKNDYDKIKASLNNRIAVIYNNLEDFEMALVYSKKALIYKGSDFFITSEIYIDVASYYAKLSQWDSCYYYANTVIKNKDENDFDFNTRAFLYLHQYYINNNKKEDAIKSLEEANKFNLNIGKDYYAAIINFFYAKYFFNERDFLKSNKYIEEAIRYDFVNNYITDFINKREVFELAAQIKNRIGDYKSSNSYLEKSLDIYKSSINNRVKSKIDNLNFKNKLKNQQDIFELQKKESQRKREKIIVIIVISIVFVILNIGYLYFIRIKNKNNKLLQLKQKISQTQIAPHFIANALMGVQKMILEKKNIEASDMVSDFSVLSNLLLQNVRETDVSLDKEIEFIEKYISFQQFRKNTFNYTIKINNSINKKNIFIPPLITQPFIENAIEHGFFNLSQRGDLVIEYIINPKYILVTINDNGIGMERKELKKIHSYSYKIIKERIILFNKIFNKTDFNLQIKSDLNQGTTVTIQIPYKTLI